MLNIKRCSYLSKFKYSKFVLIFFTLLSQINPISIKANINPDFTKEIIKTSNAISIDYLNRLPKDDYILGNGDILNIKISRSYPELNTIVQIDGEGTIIVPKLGRIFVNDITIKELKDLLDIAYQEYVKYPELEIYIKSYRPIRVIVKGEVNNPGFQTLDGSVSIIKNNVVQEKGIPVDTFFFPTVFDAIRSSQGLTNSADLKNITLKRRISESKNGGYKKTNLNFSDFNDFANKNVNLRIFDGDIIEVFKSNSKDKFFISDAIKSNLNPEFINVSVNGRVNNPGRIKVSQLSSLNEALLLSGGVKVMKGKIVFIRFLNDGTLDKRKINYNKKSKSGSFNNPYLRENDIIFVSESFFSTSTAIITEVTNPFIGLYSTYGLIKALD